MKSILAVATRAGARRAAMLPVAALCAALLVPAVSPASFNKQFRTPSGKISCGYYSYPDLEPPAGPAIRCDLLFLNDRAVYLGTSGKARKIHVTDAIGSPIARRLAYGTSTRFGPFTCTSRTTGLTCRHRRNGHGFTVSRASQKVF